MRRLAVVIATISAIAGPAIAQPAYQQQFGSSYGAPGVAPAIPQRPSSYPPVYQPDHAVRGYTNQYGTQVQPYRATNPNSTRCDNYSSRGNVNPYTGQKGSAGGC